MPARAVPTLQVARMPSARIRRLARDGYPTTALLNDRMSRDPAERALFLLDRSRYRTIRQVYLDIFRALDSTVPPRSPLLNRSLQTIGFLRGDCRIISKALDELEHVLGTGADGRKFVAGMFGPPRRRARKALAGRR